MTRLGTLNAWMYRHRILAPLLARTGVLLLVAMLIGRATPLGQDR